MRTKAPHEVKSISFDLEAFHSKPDIGSKGPSC
jgi:hypothetical protein